MRSFSCDRSLLIALVWFFVGPFIALGHVAIFVFGFSVLAVAMQLVAALLRHAHI